MNNQLTTLVKFNLDRVKQEFKPKKQSKLLPVRSVAGAAMSIELSKLFNNQTTQK